MAEEKATPAKVKAPERRRTMTPAVFLGYLEGYLAEQKLATASTIHELIGALEHDIVVEARSGTKRNISRTKA